MTINCSNNIWRVENSSRCFQFKKSGVALYLKKSKLSSKPEELGLVFGDDVSLLALEKCEKYLLFSSTVLAQLLMIFFFFLLALL